MTKTPRVMDIAAMATADRIDWEARYQSEVPDEMPWFLDDLDPDLAQGIAAVRLPPASRFLDIGTGPGTQAIELARRGFKVTASDISPTAVQKARDRANRIGARVEFVVDNLLESQLEGPFDAALDRGVFHVMSPALRYGYISTLARLLRPGGVVFLKCFSTEEPGEEGPYRISAKELYGYFGNRFDVVSVHDTTFHGNRKPPPKALFAVLERLAVGVSEPPPKLG